MTGTILRLDPRGFGFITHEGTEIYFNGADVVRKQFDVLIVGQAVTFMLRRRPGKAPKAVGVMPCSPQAVAA